MSYRRDKRLALAATDLTGITGESLKEMAREVLAMGMHGLCFSPYEEGQKPGDHISEDQIRRRMEIIRPYTKWIRSFSCTEGNEEIPRIAKEFGIKTMVGAWLGDDPEINREEVANLIALAREGYVDIAAVGNEVLLRGDLKEDELLGFINQVKQAVPDIPVGYVDAYYEFADHPRISEACDVILANCYPFWEGCSLEYSILYMKDMFHRALKAGNGKKVIISETGWPSTGSSTGGAHPSFENFLKYFINTQKWAEEDGIEVFYFSSFDESWKVGAEGDVGAYWGLWDKEESLKF
ncbi:glycosyl hydrolase family 17 protein [Robiginitalea aurantiaca]|uniref:Endo-1,3-beta-glucanase btgC n=1 Tax=Robiginitalea aurantiaca TaxID=3056915 RepID=A0ABT7WI62_9FLAO|nr:glycosyl hydrolase family 17 protein [Robiginitalea aurantiaca]MDM9632600.1 glycosyl hydrolase family 17 protein [Robiginitalea aurantiaca]